MPELLKLLKEADFNPELIISREQSRTLRDRDQLALNKLKGIWNFWKKKTTWSAVRIGARRSDFGVDGVK